MSGLIAAALAKAGMGEGLAVVLAEAAENLVRLYADGQPRKRIDRAALLSRRAELRLIREAKLAKAAGLVGRVENS